MSLCLSIFENSRGKFEVSYQETCNSKAEAIALCNALMELEGKIGGDSRSVDKEESEKDGGDGGEDHQSEVIEQLKPKMAPTVTHTNALRRAVEQSKQFDEALKYSNPFEYQPLCGGYYTWPGGLNRHKYEEKEKTP